MISKKEAKKEIEGLVTKYENLPKSRLKKISEADTGRIFIMPLFRALGWDVFNDFSSNEVIQEETTISGRIDYSFRLNNITQFILEAKAIPEDLDKEKWARQAIEYGWNKGIPWVVLSDFEGLKVFNSDWKKEHPEPNLEFKYGEYIKRFDRLWLLSKESFEKGKLDKLLSEFGIKAKRISVNEKLAEDLLKWRETLTNNLKAWNKNEGEEIIEESVQRILDRLIFIRVVEDRKLEERKLWQTFQKWVSNDHNPQNFLNLLVPIFRVFDGKYNSNLFIKHVCEKLHTTFDPFNKIIPDLYADKEKGVKYRFDAIDADVLGNVYEQYLGYVQGREGGKSKRKKQGIYYTPTYIVDYIVQNTLGKALEEKSLTEIESIKVLDPACGSGSFLIRAFDVLNEKIKKERDSKDGVQAALRKYRILTNNIYGVDLDSQAVEIARLNLLLKALEPNHKLPMLTDNIKVGNSLIEDEKVTDNAFVWKKAFSKIMSNGGFDIVIGNPPYVFTRKAGFKKEEKEYFKNTFLIKIKLERKDKALQTGKLNLFTLFLLRSTTLLKEGGILGFIIPNTFLRVNTYIGLRKYILSHFKILKIVDAGAEVFKGVTSSTVIIVLKKELVENERAKNTIEIVRLIEKETFKINQSVFANNENFIFSTVRDEKSNKLIQKLTNDTVTLGKIVQSFNGIATKKNKDKYILDKKENSLCKPLLEGKDIHKYGFKFRNKYILYDREKLHRPRNEKIFLSPEKIITQRIGGGSSVIVAALDNKQHYTFNSVNNLILQDENFSIKYILALLNSKLLNWYYVTKFTNRSKLTVNISKTNLEQLPIKKITYKEQNAFDDIVNSILDLKNRIKNKPENSDEWKSLEERIEALEKKVNQEVYKLYGLTPEEIETVEGSTK